MWLQYPRYHGTSVARASFRMPWGNILFYVMSFNNDSHTYVWIGPDNYLCNMQ
jgi:hypothetical protein